MNSSSKYTYLLVSEDQGLTWKKLFDIKDYPDQGNDPEQLETTSLSDRAHTYIEGMEANDAKEFTLNYDLDVYKAINVLKGKSLSVCLSFGENGELGQFVCTGYLTVGFTGKGVNEVREMKATLTPTSQFDLSEELIVVS